MTIEQERHIPSGWLILPIALALLVLVAAVLLLTYGNHLGDLAAK